MGWQQRIELALSERQRTNARRQRVVHQYSDGATITVTGRQYRQFSSNDYLGLSQHPGIISAWQEGLTRYGAGAGASGHVTGYSEAHQQLENRLADWLGYSHALLFNSGYAANQALIHLLMQQEDRLLADKLSHASLLEAASHSPATLRRFSHNQPESLARLLALPATGETLVVTEGVFSMDGDQAPLAALHRLTEEAGGWLLVDDAHGIGVLGEQGRGSCWQQGIRPAIQVITFGKAFGISGAAVLCDAPVADWLLQFARHLIYSTAMPPAQAVAIDAALEVIQQGDRLRQRLQANIARFRAGAADLPWQLMASDTAIQPLLAGDNQQALALAQHLRAAGCWVTAIRPPAVPPGSARLRLTLTAAHQDEDIDALLEALYAAADQ